MSRPKGRVAEWRAALAEVPEEGPLLLVVEGEQMRLEVPDDVRDRARELFADGCTLATVTLRVGDRAYMAVSDPRWGDGPPQEMPPCSLCGEPVEHAIGYADGARPAEGDRCLRCGAIYNQGAVEVPAKE